MKILTVSDVTEPILYDHFDPKSFPDVELILSCGDLPPEYLTFLAHSFQVPVYYVYGNHDIRSNSKPPEGCINLNAKIAQYGGIRFLGLEGSRWYNGGPHQYTERQMRKIIRSLRLWIWWRGGIDVVITHAPPRHIHDAEDRCHRGFESFRRLIDKYAPRYFIHGHIHAHFTDPSQRITAVHKTKVVNSYGYFLFEIDNDGNHQKI